MRKSEDSPLYYFVEKTSLTFDIDILVLYTWVELLSGYAPGTPRIILPALRNVGLEVKILGGYA